MKTPTHEVIQTVRIYDARGNGNGNISPTLTGDHQSRITDYTAIAVEVTEMKQEPICFLDDVRLETDENGTAFALRQRDHKGCQCVCYNREDAELDTKDQTMSIGNGQTNNVSMSPVANALDCMHDQQAVLKVEEGNAGRSIVRRLTPTECARLQGFPDKWVDIGTWTDSKGKSHKDADTPKYKAYGNSIAVGFANDRSGFWCWLMRRISAQYERRATMGSLFSGIEGFGLAWAAVNGPESVRWSSEIEEFPIAVIKKHFGDEDAGIKGDFYDAINGG